MNKLPILVPGDCVEIIAPASRCSDSQLLALKELLESWDLNCLVKDNLFGNDLLCANSDEHRFEHLKSALLNPETKAIICARGGYGSMRLIPQLMTVQPPETTKIFVGMSDTTCLQLYLMQHWNWPVIHGAAAPDRFSKQSIAALRALLFADETQVEFSKLTPMNQHAQSERVISSRITGGNLAIIQSGIGTSWQMDAQDRIILLEEVGERGYKVDRMLQHLQQANLFKNAQAILLGDFLTGEEPDGSCLIEPVLQRFAQQCHLPVLRIEGIGHGATNYPIPCGTPAQLLLGRSAVLTCQR